MNSHSNSYTTYARVAGIAFFFYIVAGITSLSLGSDTPIINLLYFLQNLSALVLGVTLYLLTREHGPALALLALTCRIMEAVHDESAAFFAVGSLFFSILLLRGRVIPIGLAWLGVIASALLTALLPLQLGGLFGGTMSWSGAVTWIVWMPMLFFEVGLALWFLIKGVNAPKVFVGND
ncbi:MAG: hypothetical protein HY867_19720 [Chloroflexi bacterium]|nr:hypothetical protein [Chloroflexota bacterium]